jgi:hypothetical protein
MHPDVKLRMGREERMMEGSATASKWKLEKEK